VQVGCCTSFVDLRTIDGIVYVTYRDACHVLRLLAYDREFVDDIKEVSKFASGYLKKQFVSLLISNCMSRASDVWESFLELLVDGILY